MQMRCTLLSIAALSLAGAVGCAHHRQNQYAYAPPLAPAVYPQPALPDAVAPPAVSMPVMAAPAGVAPPPGAPPAAVPYAAIPTAATIPCDPCHQGMPGAGGVVYADGQTPPCPQ